MGFLGVQPISGDCKERVTLCSGFSGVNALSGSRAKPCGLLGQSPNPLGRAHNYVSGACSYSGLYQWQAIVCKLQPTASALLRQGGFSSSLPIGDAPTSTRSKSSISFCRTGFFSIIRWRILSASTKWLAVLITLPSRI